MHLRSEADRMVEEGVRVNVIGRRDRLQPALVDEIVAVEARTRTGTRLHLQIAVDYSGRDAILAAAGLSADAPPPTREVFAARIGRALHLGAAIPDVDLVVRTGGDQRLSDFLLWECAYAELVFTPRLWPDFDESDLAAAVREFQGRERRFGGRPQQRQTKG
jgi:undecaprenyl diphosphate synthase